MTISAPSNNNYGLGDPAQPQLYVPVVVGGSNGVPTAVPEPAAILVWSLLGAASWLGMGVSRHGRRVGRQPWSDENRAAILETIAKR